MPAYIVNISSCVTVPGFPALINEAFYLWTTMGPFLGWRALSAHLFGVGPVDIGDSNTALLIALTPPPPLLR